MTSFGHIRFEIADEVAVVTLDRPEAMNAFTGRMGAELGEAYARCDEDDAVRVVVVTGAGDAFCAGADVSGGERTFDADTSAAFTSSPIRPPAFEVRKPVIAAVNGHAIGIGLTLAMQCDIRLVADEAKLGFVHVRRGVLPDAHSHWTVPRVAGSAVAADLFLTGRRFTGSEAVALGLASRALPADQVLPAARELSAEIVENVAPLSAAASKWLLWHAPDAPDEVDRLESEWHRVVMNHPDAREGPLAWVERRTPEWTGRVPGDWPPERDS